MMGKVKGCRGSQVALALGGGAARGIAHIGVLKALEAMEISVCAVAGTSVGSFIGACFCAGLSWRDLLAATRTVSWSELAVLTLPKMGFMRLDGLERVVDRMIGGRSFEELAVPFAAVATDLQTGEEVVLRSGRVARAVRASCSIPGIFEPALVDGRYLADGGLVSDVPVAVARRMGAGTVVGVSLNVEAARGSPPRSIIDVLTQTFEIFIRSGSLKSLAEADFVVAPPLGGFSYSDLGKVDELVEAGERAALRALSEAPRRRRSRWPWFRGR
jgi:NTE family protein